jgi:hypothetical protein
MSGAAMIRWPAFIVGTLVGAWLTYLWINPHDPYANVQTGDSCGDGVHWVITAGKRDCIPN